MALITVPVNGRSYDITCDDGQQAHVRELARYIDERIAELVAGIGQAGESRLLLLACLLVGHELWEARKGLMPPTVSHHRRALADDRALLDDLASLAERIEAIAARLEAP